MERRQLGGYRVWVSMNQMLGLFDPVPGLDCTIPDSFSTFRRITDYRNIRIAIFI